MTDERGEAPVVTGGAAGWPLEQVVAQGEALLVENLGRGSMACPRSPGASLSASAEVGVGATFRFTLEDQI